MTVANLYSLQDDVVDDPRVSTPDTQTYHGHLVPTVKRHRLLLHVFLSVSGECNETLSGMHENS